MTDNVKRILIIGNSHSVDAFDLLYQAYNDVYPDKKVALGIAYYSGCSITKHIDFYKNDTHLYRYYKNTDGEWDISDKNRNLTSVLTDMEWDIVFLQAAKSDIDDTLNESGRRKLEGIVNAHVKNPHEFMWHTSWPSPNDERFFADDAPKKVPDGYKDNLIRLYGFDPINQFTVLTDAAKKHILKDKTYTKAVCTGAAVMNAHITQGCPQIRIWRDYTHLNDFGHMIVAYAMLVQLTGKPIDKIGIDVIPQKLRHKQFEHLGDMQVTDEMKQIIVTAANHSLKDPWSVPSR